MFFPAKKDPQAQSSATTTPAPKPIVETIDQMDTTSEPSESSQNEDNDPMVLTERYIELKTALWKTNHAKPVMSQTAARRESRAKKLQSKLASIERDLLFESEEAQNIWKPIEIRLEAEESIKRKVAKKTVPMSALLEQTGTGHGKESEQSINSGIGSSGDAQEDEDESADVFGSMFAAPEEQLDNQPHPLAKSVRILDFADPTGLSPQQLLEQTCRTIDPKFKVKPSILQQTSYSARHQLQLFWNVQTPAQDAIQAVPDGITVRLKPHQWTLEMISVAGRTKELSIRYISAVMLFLVSSLAGQEVQTSLRLAGDWRALLVSMSDVRKQAIRSNDVGRLRSLRRMIDDTVGKLHNQTESTSIQSEEQTLKALPTHHRHTDTRLFTPERARREWNARSTSPAYKRMLVARQQLPIYLHKDAILEAVFAHPVSILSAETGSGKSTQVGSYILEHELFSGRDCHILVTQPRRISAITLARRVSQELGEAPYTLGSLQSLVGYSIRLESKTSATTRLIFATTGVLLRMLESSPMLDQLDCIILDEVHERTLETDLLFIALRELLKKREKLRIILMSATVDAQGFSKYFDGAPILDIPGRTFPVEIGYLEDAIEATNTIATTNVPSSPEPEESAEEERDADDQPPKERTISDQELKGYSKKTIKRLTKMDEYRIDYHLIVQLATAIATEPKYAQYSSAILIFMPGIAEIRRLHRALSSTDTFSHTWRINLLHSSFSTEELEQAFMKPPSGQRKIVIATNIAETGITIPDVTAVIDTCKEKIMRYNERRQLSKLTEGFISRSSAKQRRGRAARVQEGICFHLVTKQFHDTLMQEQSTPEILRLSLQDPILRLKIWDYGSAEEILAAAITPPLRKNVVRAVEKLREAGALTGFERLTSLGEQVARLPLDVGMAKLAILGAIFGCLDPVLAIISILTSKSPFTGGKHAGSYFGRSDSDLLSALNAYAAWKRARANESSFQFCQKNFLSEQTLVQIEEQKVQLLVYLVDGGQVKMSPEERHELNKARVTQLYRRDFYELPQRYNMKVSDDVILSLISMSFYPRVLLREGRGWKNVYTNQQVSLGKGSINLASHKSVKWLSFSEAMQARPGNLHVHDTSRIPEAALALLLGEAEVKMFSGVVSIDSGKIRLSLGNWKQAIALKTLRNALARLLDRSHRRPGEPLSEKDQQWLRIFMEMMAVRETEIK